MSSSVDYQQFMHPDPQSYPVSGSSPRQDLPNKPTRHAPGSGPAAGRAGQEGGGGSPISPSPAAATGSDDTRGETNGLSDREVSVLMGISLNHLRSVRKKSLKRGPHWVVRGKSALWTQAGVEALKKFASEKGATGPLSSRLPSPAAMTPQNSAKNAPWRQQRAAWRVWKGQYRNPRVISCVAEKADEPESNDQLTFIRVRDSRNFVRGMVLEAVEEKPGVWSYQGRLPRWRGKW